MNDTPTTVMIVDDNTHARAALTSCLSSQAGIQIIAQAANGLEALRLIERRPPDVVLMDAHMPVMDGLSTVRRIKKFWPRVKVIMLTMYPNYQAESARAGGDAFLVKGCSLQEVLTAIHTLTNRNPILLPCQ